MQNCRWLLLTTLGLTVATAIVGCATAPAPKSATTASAPSNQDASTQVSNGPAQRPTEIVSEGKRAPAVMASPAPAGAAATAPVTSPAKTSLADGALRQERSVKERPGLATQFGEDLRRDVRHTRFERESQTSAFLTTSIWYNDAVGAQAMAQHSTSRSGSRAEVEMLNGGLVVAITDEWFSTLPGFIADARPYAIGEANARYAIRIANRTDFSFEVVASVDGLDVIDGRPAAVDRRGYILSPRDTMSIEGFRTSESMIAAFRFGKVAESYSVQTGNGDRNVGVIGIAFFNERGTTPLYPSEDTRLRKDANPFPGEYAPRPKTQPQENPWQAR